MSLAAGAARPTSRQWLLPCVAGLLLAGWVYVLYSFWQYAGLFAWLGVDYAVLWAGTRAFLSHGAAAAYDQAAAAEAIKLLAPYVGAGVPPPHAGLMSLPPILVLLFAPLVLLPPPAGFLLWVVGNLALAALVARDVVHREGRGSLARTLLVLTFFPLVLALMVGQPVMLLLFGLHRAYRAFEKGDDWRAGVWAGALLLKPQYAAFLGLVLLYKRRWRAVAGMAAAGAAILIASLAVGGVAGLQAYFRALTQFTGFREVDPTVAPQLMTNWRAILANFFPGLDEAHGRALTLGLSILSAGLLPVIWRGTWEPKGERFAARMLGTLLVTVLASPHSHAHGITLLLVPGSILALEGHLGAWSRSLLKAALFAPTLVFFLTSSMLSVSLILLLILIASLFTLLAQEVLGRAARIGPEQAPATPSLQFGTTVAA